MNIFSCGTRAESLTAPFSCILTLLVEEYKLQSFSTLVFLQRSLQ
jgi:hypothetical protein